ncbi:hypothetical protein OpiT1DRAFT_05621 [Opitutaceae bacterium TAV1]|nr:hypothetical protein OpiT1DRAFT_05621 [Opitutaceae bacterium TAV1]
MSNPVTSRLVQLDAQLEAKLQSVGFARDPRQEEKSSALRTAGKVVAGTAALGGAGYVGSALLRGRGWQKQVLGKPVNSGSGLLGALKTGARRNNRDIVNAYSGAKAGVQKGGKATASGARTAADATANAARAAYRKVVPAK